MKEDENTYYDKKIKHLKNNRAITIGLILFAIVIGFGQLYDVWEKIFSKEKSELPIRTPSDTLTLKKDTIFVEKKMSIPSTPQKGVHINTDRSPVEVKPNISINDKLIKTEDNPSTSEYSFTILSDEGAKIYVDNKFIGISPCTAKLKKGSYPVMVKLGESVCEDVINIPTQKILTITVKDCK